MEKIINSLIAIAVIASVLIGAGKLMALTKKDEQVAESPPAISILPSEYRGQKQTLFTLVAEEDMTCMEVLHASTETCFQLMRQVGRNTVKSGEV